MEIVKYADAGGDTIKYLRFPDGLNLAAVHDYMDFDVIKSCPLRQDDVLICSYPRTGCHWLWETTRMLLSGQTDYTDNVDKEDFMLEFKAHTGELDHVASPRILSTHFHFRYLPHDVITKRVKIIFVYRQPKDVAVSLYNLHVKGSLWDYSGSFSNWIQLFQRGQVDYGRYSDYLLDWERAIAAHTDLPVHVTTYEGLHQNAQEELTRLSSFLGKNHNDSFLKSVAEACAFDRIQRRKGSKWRTQKSDFLDACSNVDIGSGDTFMYRKGKVRDWENWFTAAESKQFDQYWATVMAGSKFADV